MDNTSIEARTKDLIIPKYDYARNLAPLGGEPVIFHCHHYNVFLQAAIEDTASIIDPYPILTDSAEEVGHSFLTNLQKSGSLSAEEILYVGKEHFRNAGYGKITTDPVSKEQGKIQVTNSHYAVGWKAKFGMRSRKEKGVCFFAAGYLQALLAARFGEPLGSYEVIETECSAYDGNGNTCTFAYRKLPSPRGLTPSAGMGQTIDKLHSVYKHPTGVDGQAIVQALTQMPIVGDAQGSIFAFGVYLTRMFANYYAKISFKTTRALIEKSGEEGKKLAGDLFAEAGHVCAFNTLGGIMISAEWDAMIKPMLKTREDWAHGIIAVMNALGWGVYQVKEIVPNESFRMTVDGSYETNMYLATYGFEKNAVCNFNRGAAAGIMNLLYHIDIMQKPTLSQEFYDTEFKKSGKFVSSEVRCRVMKHDCCEFDTGRERG